jgi:glyoxylase-like metal-dependent hydrolase (beta-lactamase superfamily II)
MIKKVLKVIAAIVVVAILLLAIFLIPAHLQVRGVAPPLPVASDFLSLRSEAGPQRVSYVLTSSQKLERGQISHISVLVEWADGRMFMIDAGMEPSEAKEFAKLLKKLDPTAGDARIVGAIDDVIGPDIQRIEGVGFTHLHIDHTQGLESFCQARGQGSIGLQSADQTQLHNFNTSEGATIVTDSCLENRTFNGDTLTRFNDFPGLAAFSLGGHTPGSTLWAVALKDKVLLFSGDITNDKASIDHDKPKPILYSYVLVPENVGRTAELRKWLLTLDKNQKISVIVSHDLNNTQAHLSEYKPQ